MRILLVYPSPLSNVFFQAFIEGFLGAGHEIGVCTAPPVGFQNLVALPPEATLYEVNLARGARPSGHVRALRGVRQAVAAFKPDIVHAHMSAAIFTVAVARQWQEITIGTFHGLRYPLASGIAKHLVGAAERLAISRLDQVQVVNSFDFGLVTHDCPGSHCLLLRSGFGCELERFDPERFDTVTRSEVRRQLGFSDDSVVGAFVGRLVSFKGVQPLVRAFRELRTVDTEARLLMIGDRDAQHPTGLTHADEEWLRHTNAIRMIGFSEAPERYLSACDYLVMPSIREGLSTVIMEALCLGLPVVTTTARGCGELVHHGETGLIVTPGDSQALVTALLEMTRNVSARRQWALAARGQRGRFDRNACVREMLDIYDRLFAGSERN